MKKTQLLGVLVLLIPAIAVVAYGYSGQDQPDAQWRMTPLNNGGFVIEGPMPTLQMAEPEPVPVFSYEEIDGRGRVTGATSVPIDRIISIGAHSWPVYDADKENVIDIRYATAVRYGDGRWSWTDQEYHEVAAHLLSLGWAVGDAPAQYRDRRHDLLPLPVDEFQGM